MARTTTVHTAPIFFLPARTARLEQQYSSLPVLSDFTIIIVSSICAYLQAFLPAQQCRTRHSRREETGPPAPRSGHHLQTQARNPATQWTEAAEHVFNQKPTTATNCLYHSRTYFQFTLWTYAFAVQLSLFLLTWTFSVRWQCSHGDMCI